MEFSTYVKHFLLTLVFGIACADSFGQAISVDTLEKIIAKYNTENPKDILYLVTDKQIYLPSETIWFAAYLMETIGKTDTTLFPGILSVALLSEDTTGVSVRKNYLVKNRTCAGSLMLPESLSPGNYQLLACTNIADGKGAPIHIFRMPITIKSATLPAVDVEFEVKEQTGTDSLFVLVKTRFPVGISAVDRRNAYLSYNLDQGMPHKIKYNLDGSAKIALLRSALKNSPGLLYTTTKIGKNTKQFNVRLPVPNSEKPEVGFYPEGGDLVAGLVSRIAWQAVFGKGTGQKLKAMLLENGKTIDTIFTDHSGTGLFNLKPKPHAEYAVKILMGIGAGLDQIFPLPRVLPAGFVLKITEALAGDTLDVDLSASMPAQVRVAISSQYTRASVLSPVIALDQAQKKLRIALSDVKKGLNTLTLLDDQGRPVAERLFFAHFNEGSKARLSSDKNSYHTREKVSLSVSLSNEEEKLVAGLFTVSCVQESRLDSSARQNLANYYYMEPIGGSLNERMLMIRGWRRYLWQSIMQPVAASDRTTGLHALHLKALIKYNDGSRFSEGANVTIQHDSLLNSFQLDQLGYFYPNPEDVSIREDRKLDIKVIDKRGFISRKMLSVDDPMKKLMQFVVSLPGIEPTQNLAFQERRQGQADISFTKTNLLNTVVINRKATKQNAPGYGANDCGDYVCNEGYLNCLAHDQFFKGSRPAVKGESYYQFGLSYVHDPNRKVYKGCQWDDVQLAVYTARQFYGVDSLKLGRVAEKEYLSTLFWKDFTVVSNGQDTGFNFYTGDLTGRFKIRVEGIAENGELFYEEKNITISDRIEMLK